MMILRSPAKLGGLETPYRFERTRVIAWRRDGVGRTGIKATYEAIDYPVATCGCLGPSRSWAAMSIFAGRLVMISSSGPEVSSMVRFPRFTEFGDLNSLSIVTQDLSLTYDFCAIMVLPGYERVPVPGTRFGPRRWSPLRAEDRLKVRRISLGSPLEIIFTVGETSATIAGVAAAVNRVLVTVKTWTDVLAAGLDRSQRRQALEEDRALAPERLRQIQLGNALTEQQLRRATAEADLVERARNEILLARPLGEVEYIQEPPRRRRASQLTAEDAAELLDEPIRRILSYSGGEIEVGDEYYRDDESS
jgi:hypothetical protein